MRVCIYIYMIYSLLFKHVFVQFKFRTSSKFIYRGIYYVVLFSLCIILVCSCNFDITVNKHTYILATFYKPRSEFEPGATSCNRRVTH